MAGSTSNFRGASGRPHAGPTAPPSSPLELTPARIDALVRLLGDEDPKIHEVARQHLLAAIDKARPYLQDHARAGSNPEVRRQARLLMTDAARAERLAQWSRFAQGGDPLDLETGAFFIAQVEFPELDFEPCRRLLDEFAAALAARLGPARSPDGLVPKLTHLLFRELGFEGNRQDYYDPDNSLLNRVLERRLGIPISLSVVCMLVAGRLGLTLEGVGMPRHFILRLRSGGKEQFFDPFNGGRPWSLEDCLEYLRAEGYTLAEDLLRSYTTRQILIRMLANLLHIYRGREDAERSQRLTGMLEELNPDASAAPPKKPS